MEIAYKRDAQIHHPFWERKRGEKDQDHGVRSLLSCLEAEQLIEVRRIDEDLLRLSKAGFAAELAPNGSRFGKVAGGGVPPYLIPFGRSQDRPQGLGRSHEAVEKRGPILVRSTRRFVEQENPPWSGRVADRRHQAQLVVGRQVMER